MARRSKREKTVPVAVGLAGSGKIAKKAMKEHLSEYIEAQDSEILWVLPYTDEAAKPLKNVMDFLWEEGAKYILVSDGTAEDADLEEAAESLVEVDEAAEVAVVNYLADMEADKKAVILLLNEDDDADTDLAVDAAEKELQIFDLASGMHEVEIRDEGDVEEGDDPEEPEEEEPAAEEAEEESEEDVEESDVEINTDALSGVPESVMNLIGDEDLEGAATKLQQELGKNEIKQLADEIGLEIPKGQWAKTTAQNLVALVADSGEAPEVASEPETEPEVEAPAEEPQDAVVAETKKPSEVAKTTNGHAPINDRDILHLLAQITMAKDTEEAKKFYEFLTESNFV